MLQLSNYQHLEYRLHNCEQLHGHRTGHHDEKNRIGLGMGSERTENKSEACGQSTAGSRIWSESSRVRADTDMWTKRLGRQLRSAGQSGKTSQVRDLTDATIKSIQTVMKLRVFLDHSAKARADILRD